MSEELELKRQELSLKRRELNYGLVKFCLGTVALGLITAWLNHQIQVRQLDMDELRGQQELALRAQELEFQELERLSYFVDAALAESAATRLRLAVYLASVAHSDDARARWEAFRTIVQAEVDSLDEEREQILQLERALAARSALTAELRDSLDALAGERQRIDQELRVDRLSEGLSGRVQAQQIQGISRLAPSLPGVTPR